MLIRSKVHINKMIIENKYYVIALKCCIYKNEYTKKLNINKSKFDFDILACLLLRLKYNLEDEFNENIHLGLLEDYFWDLKGHKKRLDYNRIRQLLPKVQVHKSYRDLYNSLLLSKLKVYFWSIVSPNFLYFCEVYNIVIDKNCLLEIENGIYKIRLLFSDYTYAVIYLGINDYFSKEYVIISQNMEQHHISLLYHLMKTIGAVQVPIYKLTRKA